MKIGELFIELGIVGDTAGALAFNSAVTALSTSFESAKIAIDLAYKALDRFIGEAIRGVVTLTNFNQQTDLSILKLQQWQVAGSIANIGQSAEETTQSIANLQSNLAQIKLGGGNVAPFQLLGIDIYGKDAFQILDEVREQIQGLDSATAVNLIEQMGLTPNFINVLRLSKEEFQQINKEFFINKDQQSSILKLGTTINQLKIKIQMLTFQAVAKLAPYLETVLVKFLKWLEANAPSIVKFVEVLIKLTVGLVTSLAKVGEMIYKIVKGIGDFFVAVMGAKAAITSLIVLAGALIIAFAPIELTALAIGAALLALYLVLDDIATWMRGGQSLFGGVYDWIAGIADKVGSVISKIKILKDLIGEANWNKLFGGDSPGGTPTGGAAPIEGFLTGGAAPIDITKDMLPVPSVNTSNITTSNTKDIDLTQNNTFNITSNAKDGRDVAGSLQPILNNTMSAFNNGGF